MTEFKLTKEFSDDIESLRSAAEKVNSSASVISTDGIGSLKTSVRYTEQHKAIMELMTMYEELLLKDASDLNEMVTTVEAADINDASEYN